VISGFRREVRVDENCALLGYCTAITGNFLPTFRDNLSGPTPEDGTDMLSRNVGKELLLLAV
jgi:hypothetical protein